MPAARLATPVAVAQPARGAPAAAPRATRAAAAVNNVLPKPAASSAHGRAPADHPAVSHAHLFTRLRRMAAEEHPFMYGAHSLASRFASADPRGQSVDEGGCE